MYRDINRFIKVLSIIIISLLFFNISSCSSSKKITLIKKQKKDQTYYPDWWKNKKSNTENYIYIYANAEGDSYTSSYINAYSVLIKDLIVIHNNKEENENDYLTSLITEFSIKSIGLNIENIVVIQSSENNYECFIQSCIQQKAKLTKQEKDEYLQDRETVINLINNAKELYRSYYDTQALELYVKALSISVKYPFIDQNLSFSAISERIERIINNIYFVFLDLNSENINFTVQVKRRVGIIHPIVRKSSIKITAPFEDYSESFSYISDNNGIFRYHSTLRNINSKGELKISINEPTNSELFRENDKLAEFGKKISNLIDKNSVLFEYNKLNQMNSDGVFSFFSLKDLNVYLDSFSFSPVNEFISNLQKNNIRIRHYNFTSDKFLNVDDENIYSSIPNLDRYFLYIQGNVEETSVINSTNEYTVYVSLVCSVFDVQEKKCIYKTYNIGGVGIDDDINKAIEKAYNSAFLMLSSSIKGVIV